MVLLEQYVTLYERRWQNVFIGWKYFQITMYLVTAVAGILASFCWTRINYGFEDNCILYANITFYNKGDSDDKRNSDVNKDTSQFGREVYCSYCQYVPVCSVLFAAMWLTFFTMCGRGGRSDHGLPQPWRIVYPAMIFNFLLFFFSLIAIIWFKDGHYQFCKFFKENNNKTSCQELREYSLFDTRGEEIDLYFFLAEAGTWGVTFGWLIGAVLLVTRCCFLADFTVMKITVISATPVEEEAPKASPESTTLSPEENPSSSLNVPPIL